MEEDSATFPSDCRGCGACCFSASVEFVRVTGDDWARLGNAAERWAHFSGHRAFMRMTNGHCAALQVQRTTSGALDFTCAIYERRPQVCRDLARGSRECAGEIATKARIRRGSVGLERGVTGAGGRVSPSDPTSNPE